MGLFSKVAPWAALAILSAAPAAAAEPAQVAPVEARLEALLSELRPTAQVAGRDYPGQSLAELMRHYRVPAVSIAYVEKGRIAWARAFGSADVAAAVPATDRTLFQAASISKPVAASGALALVAAGRLSLDGPVNAQLSGWRVPDNDFTRQQPVTLRHLLTHTGGLTVHGFPGYAPAGPVPTVEQILDGAPPANTAPVRVDQRPGAAWRYSGGGYTVLQHLMSQASGEPFAELMERLVLRPAGMTDSVFGPLGADRAAAAATGYRHDGSAIAQRHYVHPELAAAGLWATPTDLVRWAMAVSAAYAGRTGGPIAPAEARAMLRAGTGDWGLGMPVHGSTEMLRFSHGGSNQGFRAQLVFFPARGEGLAVMTNGDNGDKLIGSILQAVGRSLGWPDSEPHVVKAAAADPALQRDAVGRYGNEEIKAELTLAGDRLMMALDGGPPAELVPQGKDKYVFIDMGLEVTADRDPATRRVVSISGAGVTLPRLP